MTHIIFKACTFIFKNQLCIISKKNMSDNSEPEILEASQDDKEKSPPPKRQKKRKRPIHFSAAEITLSILDEYGLDF